MPLRVGFVGAARKKMDCTPLRLQIMVALYVKDLYPSEGRTTPCRNMYMPWTFYTSRNVRTKQRLGCPG